MTTYRELCDAYFSWERHQVEIDRICRELPWRLCRAISEHVGAPSGQASFPGRRAIAYVDLFQEERKPNGERGWQPASSGEPFDTAEAGVMRFTIGLRLETAESWSMVFLKLRIESVSETAVEIRNEKDERWQISIVPSSQESYQHGAASLVDELMALFRGSSQSPSIGFEIKTSERARG